MAKKQNNSIPVDCGIVWCLINDFNYYSIVFLSINNWSREHVIDGDDVFGVTKLRYSFGLHLFQITEKILINSLKHQIAKNQVDEKRKCDLEFIEPC